MNLDQITTQFNHLRVNEKRTCSPNYEEWVIYAEDLPQWSEALSELLGPAVKSKGDPTTKEVFASTVAYGGIFDDQIFFQKQFDGVSILAMLWPWKNNAHITLKLICVDNEKTQ